MKIYKQIKKQLVFGVLKLAGNSFKRVRIEISIKVKFTPIIVGT